MLISSIGKADRTSFGWNWSTHKEIDRRLVHKYNRFLPENMQFDDDMLVEKGSVYPDMDRKKIFEHIHGHFADIDNLSKNDAYYLAKEYTLKAIEFHKAGQYGKRDFYLGIITHLITDCLQPYQAVKFVPRGKNDAIRKAHKHFENIAEDTQKTIFNESKIDDVFKDTGYSSFFDDILPKAMRKAKNLHEKIVTGNYDNITGIISSALDNAYKTTDLYFKSVINEFSKQDGFEKAQKYFKLDLIKRVS